jgi:hypothetical protein
LLETSDCRLYSPWRDRTLTDVTSKPDFSKLAGRAGFCIGDYDNHGFDDVFATHWGQNVLYRNHGDGIFMDVPPPRLWRPGFLHRPQDLTL